MHYSYRSLRATDQWLLFYQSVARGADFNNDATKQASKQASPLPTLSDLDQTTAPAKPATIQGSVTATVT